VTQTAASTGVWVAESISEVDASAAPLLGCRGAVVGTIPSPSLGRRRVVSVLDRGREMRFIPKGNARVAAATIAAMLLMTLAPVASADHASGPCDFHREDTQTVREHSRAQIRCAVARWAVPGGADVALCIAKRESGLLPWAESGDGLNKGLFQQHVRYWDVNYDVYSQPAWQLPQRVLSGRTNTIVSIRMAHAIGWGPWGGRHCG